MNFLELIYILMLFDNKNVLRLLSTMAILLLGTSLEAGADIYTRPNKHVIISFDTAIPGYSDYVKDKKFVERHLSPVIDALQLTSEDYLSLVNFGISSQSKNLFEIGRTMKGTDGITLSWVPYTSLHDLLSMGKWEEMYAHQGVDFTKRDKSAFSLLTGSKTYTLLSQRQTEGGKTASETYMVLVTDDNYNGCDDINKEFSQMGAPFLDAKEFLDQCREVARNYNFYYEPKLSNDNIASGQEKTLKVMVFSVVPASGMALSSVVDFPANFGLHRVPDGYMMKFDIDVVDECYDVVRFDLCYTDKKGEKHTATSTTSDTKNGSRSISLNVPFSSVSGSELEVEARGWLVQKDTVYGAAMLNPNSKDFSRLSVKTALPLSDNVKAFGFMPIPFWFGRNGDSQISIWNTIYGITLLLLLFWCVRKMIKKMSVYRPQNSAISITVKSLSGANSHLHKAAKRRKSKTGRLSQDNQPTESSQPSFERNNIEGIRLDSDKSRRALKEE